MKIDLVVVLYILQNINIQTLVHGLTVAETVNEKNQNFENSPIMYHFVNSLLAAGYPRQFRDSSNLL